MRNIRKRIAERETGEATANTPANASAPAAVEAATRKNKRAKRPKKPSIAAHPAFTPMLTAWGALLLGLSVLAAPEQLALRFEAASGVGNLGGAMVFVLAGIAALIGGIAAFAAAALLKQRLAGPAGHILARKASAAVQPIDPATELGSDSFDAPIETEPFAAITGQSLLEEDAEQAAERNDTHAPTLGALAERAHEHAPAHPLTDDDTADPESDCLTMRDFESALRSADEGQTQASDIPGLQAPALHESRAGPRDIGLTEFAGMAGRNAVWVHEQPDESAPEAPAEPDPAVDDQPEILAEAGPEQVADIPEPRQPAALTKLRQIPPGELSLIQMVERFAAALHERQNEERTHPHRPKSPDRDAPLAEALKALTMFTDGAFEGGEATASPTDAAQSELGDTTRDLREALAKLQKLRGAA